MVYVSRTKAYKQKTQFYNNVVNGTSNEWGNAGFKTIESAGHCHVYTGRPVYALFSCMRRHFSLYFFFSRNNLWHKKRPNELGLLKELDRR